MEKQTALREWQEAAIEDFEGMMDKPSFEAMVNGEKQQDIWSAKYSSLVMDASDLPRELAEGHCFPGRFNLTEFDARLTQYKDEEDENLWSLAMSYRVNDELYRMTANHRYTTLMTHNLEGAELKFNLDAEASVKFLTAIGSTVVGIDPSLLNSFYERMMNVNPHSIKELLRVIGTHDETTSFLHEQLVWMPDSEDDRTMLLNYSEMTSCNRTGRKLDCKMAWQLDEDLTTEVTATQSDFAGYGGREPFYCQRKGIGYEPSDLLLMHQFGVESDEIGAFFDSDANRQQYGHVVTAIRNVLSPYLEKYRHLDDEASLLDLEEAAELQSDGTDISAIHTAA